MAFGYSRTTSDGVPTVAFEGDLDGMSIDAFEAAIMEPAQDPVGCVIVDLNGVTYIDSQSFGRLLRVHLKLEALGGDIAIVVGDTDTGRIIKIFGGDYLLGVFEDPERAVAYLKPLFDAPDHSQ